MIYTVQVLLRQPCAALDAAAARGQHLPPRNLVSTLFELNGAGAAVAAPRRRLPRRWRRWANGWPELGDRAAGALAAYAEWLSTRMPEVFPTAENERTGATAGKRPAGGQRDDQRDMLRGQAARYYKQSVVL